MARAPPSCAHTVHLLAERTHKSMSAPSERAGGRAATSPIFIRRSYVVNSWDGRKERGNAMEEEEKQAASAKTFKLSEGRREGAEAAQVQNVLHVLTVVPFPP